MTNFSSEISLTVAGTDQVLRFKTTGDLERWANAEESFWGTTDVKNVAHGLANYWRQQASLYSTIRNHIRDIQNQSGNEQVVRNLTESLRQSLAGLSQGLYITKEHELYPAIADFAKSNPELACIILCASRSDYPKTLGQFGNMGLSTRSLVQMILDSARSKGTKDWLQPQRKELTALRDEYQTGLDNFREKFDEQNQAIESQRESSDEAHLGRASEWDQLKLQMASEWDALKNTYDEKLALLAPTQYWADRHREHKLLAAKYAKWFACAILCMLAIFAWLAMPHLVDAAKTKDMSPLLALIPVAIPAFAGIWVLKILSRLLSENLQMARDARERETMVKTFLALMRDDTTGKSLIQDNDRILILHSLFRPSSVSATDDAPPVHWFDILTNKVGSKGATR